MKNKRIVIKLSGEVFEVDNQEANLDFPKIKELAKSLKKLAKAGYQVAVVVGAGNIFRARMVKGAEIDRVASDHMGMMATSINALALQSVLEKIGQDARVLSSFSVRAIMEDYAYKRAINHLENGKVVVFAGGTGNPYFTTDTALVLRALEIGADSIYKATNVKGVYDSNPLKNKLAKFYKKISYEEVLAKDLQVMDITAFAMAKDNDINLRVFEYSPKNIITAITKNNIGTEVSN